MSQRTIETFYGAFQRLDGAAMASCYSARAQFEDPVFKLFGRDEVGGMWRMLTDAVRANGQDVWRIDFDRVQSTGPQGSAHWEAHYRFSATGRLVHNIIDARFEFDPSGLIAKHVDQFDFWRWARQALGPAGAVLGWTPFLKAKVRSQAARNLQKYLQKQAAPAPA